MKFADIKNDIAFRKIFGNENKKEILISLLNAVLGYTGDKKIVSITLLNPFQLPDILHYKTTVIDVKATDQSGHYYIVEMQVADKGNFEKRIQLYSAKAYTSQIVKGDDYHLLKPTIFIGILNFNFTKSEKYLSQHITCDPETKERLLEDFEYNFIELLKFEKKILDCKSLIDKWIYFIKNAESLKVVPEEIDDKGLSEAYSDANQMSWTKEELELYDYAKMRERDVIEEQNKAVQTALENKEIEMVCEYYKNGASIELIALSSKFSIEKVKQILGINN